MAATLTTLPFHNSPHSFTYPTFHSRHLQVPIIDLAATLTLLSFHPILPLILVSIL